MKNMKKMLAVVLALIMVLGLAACGGSAPAENTTAAAGGETQAATDAATEDTLVLYTTQPDAEINRIVPMFEEKYGCKCEIITGGTGELLARIDAEGDNPYCDVMYGGGESSYTEYRHLFEDYLSPEDANLNEEFRNTTGFVSNYCVDCALFLVNNTLRDELGIKIEGYEDLLQPELEGKIAMPDPVESGSALFHVEVIHTDKGGLNVDNTEAWDYVTALFKQLGGFASGSSAAWKSVVDGEKVVALSYEEPCVVAKRDGADVTVVYPKEGTCLSCTPCGLIKNCAHPELAKKFIDFMLSKEVQQIFVSELDLRPVRDDVDYPDYFLPSTEINSKHLDQTYLNEHKTEITDKCKDITADVMN